MRRLRRPYSEGWINLRDWEWVTDPSTPMLFSVHLGVSTQVELALPYSLEYPQLGHYFHVLSWASFGMPDGMN